MTGSNSLILQNPESHQPRNCRVASLPEARAKRSISWARRFCLKLQMRVSKNGGTPSSLDGFCERENPIQKWMILGSCYFRKPPSAAGFSCPISWTIVPSSASWLSISISGVHFGCKPLKIAMELWWHTGSWNLYFCWVAKLGLPSSHIHQWYPTIFLNFPYTVVGEAPFNISTWSVIYIYISFYKANEKKTQCTVLVSNMLCPTSPPTNSPFYLIVSLFYHHVGR